MARFGAIDVGSNALRLRVVESERAREGAPASKATGWKELVSQRAPVRLGRDVFLLGTLAPSVIASACEALRRFREAMDEARVDRYRAVATSAVREAKNGHILVERAEREAGIHLETIEGIEEARLVQLAVRRQLGLDDRRALLIDIGGGSTELTLLSKGRAMFTRSLPIGTVRLLETFLDPREALTPKREAVMLRYIDRVLSEVLPELSQESFEVLVGTGGNIDALAQLCPTQTPDGAAVDVGAMRALLARLSRLSCVERAAVFDLRPDRADVIVPAAAVLLRVAEAFNVGAVVAPGVGLKEGILEELSAKHSSRWDWSGEAQAVIEICERLGRRYRFDEAHGRLVAHLATRLFDDLRKVHRLGDRERLLLHAAAVLHDIGDFVRYEGHHRHGWYIIEHSDIMGLSHVERSIVANVARYHRKGPPDVAHPNFRDLDRESRQTVKNLAAMLRIADALDREHRGKVKDFRPSIEGAKLRLGIISAPDVELEEWTVAHKAGLFRDMFGLDVQIVTP